jgi:GTPase
VLHSGDLKNSNSSSHSSSGESSKGYSHKSQSKAQSLGLKERAIVVGVGFKTSPSQTTAPQSPSGIPLATSLIDLKNSLCELEELVSTAGADIVGSITQMVSNLNPATLIGSGKVEEIRELVIETQSQVVVIDHALTGVQTRNLEAVLGVRVLDRSQVILDIFARRAQTYEGKLQVELAQMLDQLPRMVDAWMGSLSRQGGGIGTRGPGETALELDRRRIRDRVKAIRKQLDDVRSHRAQHRSSRRRAQIPSFAIIGYTNSGKSTLLNVLTKSNVLAKDQMFATLDPTTRKVFLPDGPQAVMTDTVGFIRKLPPQLIEAFKATLEESAEADILVHVVDLSSPQMQNQIDVVNDMIQEFGWGNKPILTVFNKIDQAPFEKQFQVKAFPRVFLSALKGEGVERMKRTMVEMVSAMQTKTELFFPRSDEHRIYELGRETTILRTESASSGTLLTAQLTPTQLNRWRDYLVTSEMTNEKQEPDTF